MSYSRRQLYAMGEPIGDSATRRELGGKVIYGGGGSGGGGTTTSVGTQYTSTVPKWLEGEQKEVVARGLALAEQPYQAYGGERVSQFTPLQRQAFTGAERQQIAPQLGFASGLAALGGTQSFRDPGTAGSFMNPFIEQAIAPQLQGLARQAQIEGTRQQGEATMRGAFGGSRDAIMRAEREKNLLSQQSDVLGRGFAQAFDVGQQQFNAEQARRLGAAQALGGLGQQQFGQEMDITGRQQQFGTQQQQQIQRILDQQFADFQAQRDFPYQQIGFASDLIQGRGGSTRSIYNQPGPSGLQTIAGLGTAAAGLGGLMAKGGEVKGYADGGLTALLGDQELAQRAQNPTTSPMGQLAAQQQMAENAALRAAAPQGMPQPMVEDTIDPVEAALVVEMQKAMNEGDRQRAEALAETVEKRREERMAQEEMGIAAVADDSIGDIPEGGITGMEPVMAAEGGELRFFNGGDTPYIPRTEEIDALMLSQMFPGATPRQDLIRAAEAERLRKEAERQAKIKASMEDQPQFERDWYPQGTGDFLGRTSAALDAGLAQLREDRPLAPIVEGITQNQDVLNQRRRTPEAAVAASNATDAMRNRSRKATREASQERVAEAAAAAKDKPSTAGPGTATNPMQQGLGSAVAPVPMAFDPIKARAAQEAAIRRGEEAELGEVDAEQNRFAEFIKSMGVRGEAEEKRIRESLEGIKGEKKQSQSMAFFQAGLEILSADPSRGALAAIGQGAIKGLGAYKGDLKDLEARRERMLDKLDTLDGLRRQEAFASEEGRQRIAQRRSQVKAAYAKEYRDTAKQFNVDIPLKAAETMAEQTFRLRLASMPSGEERILRALGGGDLAKGFEVSKRLGQKPADLMGEFNDYIKANPMLGTASQDQQMAAFFRTKMALGSVNVPKPTDKPTGQARP